MMITQRFQAEDIVIDEMSRRSWHFTEINGTRPLGCFINSSILFPISLIPFLFFFFERVKSISLRETRARARARAVNSTARNRGSIIDK
jgi:hypothetical protein